MSNKSAKNPGKKMSVPRQMAEIQGAYQQACANLGQVEYQIFVQGLEASRIKEQLKAINNEAAARQQLDKEAQPTAEAATQTVAAETTAEQSQAV